MRKRAMNENSFRIFDNGFTDYIFERSSNDPLGSYTGRPINREEIPVQDADDL